MGFEAPQTLYKLIFEDPGMAGLEVTVREPSIDDLLAMSGAAADAKTMTAAQVRGMFEAFAALLDSWNLERKGVPVPATYEGVVAQNAGFVMKIIAALDQTIARPDPTSPPASGSGGTGGLETSIPVTPSHANRGG
jgi:hypothetical protein